MEGGPGLEVQVLPGAGACGAPAGTEPNRSLFLTGHPPSAWGGPVFSFGWVEVVEVDPGSGLHAGEAGGEVDGEVEGLSPGEGGEVGGVADVDLADQLILGSTEIGHAEGGRGGDGLEDAGDPIRPQAGGMRAAIFLSRLHHLGPSARTSLS